MQTISIINQSTVVSDVDCAAYTAALQIQVNRDFGFFWGWTTKVVFVPKGKTAAKGSWQLIVLDTSDQAGALGYHDMTAEGLPIGKIFAKDDISNGSSVSVTMSHELLEMMVDPWINLTVVSQGASNALRIYAYEVADACEDDGLGYKIGSVLVSDFVTPMFFMDSPPTGAALDKMKHITAPYQILKGGYLGVLDATSSTTGWTQINAEGMPHEKANTPPVGCRRQRRNYPRNLWRTSDF